MQFAQHGHFFVDEAAHFFVLCFHLFVDSGGHAAVWHRGGHAAVHVIHVEVITLNTWQLAKSSGHDLLQNVLVSILLRGSHRLSIPLKLKTPKGSANIPPLPTHNMGEQN